MAAFALLGSLPLFAVLRGGDGVAAAQTVAPPLRIGVAVTPDTVQVGDPFIMTVTLEVPAGARVTWPTPADTNGPLGLRAPVRVTGTENGAVRRETAEYDMTVWALGAVPVSLQDIVVRIDDKDTTIPFQAPTVFVQSVLPADTSLQVPKPAKELFPRIVPWWEVWWPALLLLLLALIAWLLIRARRKTFAAAAQFDPFVRAERDFERLERLALYEAGEQGRFVALAVEVLRVYLSVRAPDANLALTSDELLNTVAPDSRVPTQQLAPLLVEADAIKFGRKPVTAARARALASDARDIVSAVEQAEQARRAAEQARQRAEKRTQQRQAVENRKALEEKARIESTRGKSEAA